MTKLKTLAVAVLIGACVAGIPALARAQSLDSSKLTWVDSPTPYATVSASSLQVSGWAFSPVYKQQPATLDVCYVQEVAGGGFDRRCLRAIVDWRMYRPDVAAAFTPAFGPLSPYFGYRITFQPGDQLPTGFLTLRLIWWDPTLGTKTDEVPLNVVP